MKDNEKINEFLDGLKIWMIPDGYGGSEEAIVEIIDVERIEKEQ